MRIPNSPTSDHLLVFLAITNIILYIALFLMFMDLSAEGRWPTTEDGLVGAPYDWYEQDQEPEAYFRRPPYTPDRGWGYEPIKLWTTRL